MAGEQVWGTAEGFRGLHRVWKAGWECMSNIQKHLYPLMGLTEADNYDNGNEPVLSILRHLV